MREQLGRNDKRIFLRHPVKLLIEIKSNEGKTAVVTETQDLSQGGVSFYTDWRLPIGHVIEITFLFGQKSFRMKGEISYSNEDPKLWRFFTGASFLDSTGTVYVRLANQFIDLIKADLNKEKKDPAQIYKADNDRRKNRPFWRRLF